MAFLLTYNLKPTT